MKTFRLISVILLTVLPFISAHGQDLYKGHTTLKGINNEYNVEYIDDVGVVLNNKTNVFPVYPGLEDNSYFLDTKERVLVNPPLDIDRTVFDEILRTVFTQEEMDKYSYEACGNRILFTINIIPQTGKISEVTSIHLRTITLFRDKKNPILLSIPITKIEELETLIKERIVFDIPQKYRNVNYLHTYFFIF